jgi:hypothetical protein
MNNNLKPFDIEKAKAGAKVVTREGKNVRIICYDKIGTEHPIVALIDAGNVEMVFSFTEKGYHERYEQPHSLDLFLLSEKKEGWVNVYRDKYDFCKVKLGPHVYISEIDAESSRKDCPEYITTTKIEWEE